MKRKGASCVPDSDTDQLSIAGVQPVSHGERLAQAARLPMQPRRPQRPLDIRFWNTMRDQLDLF